jgi:hypothetical protein
MTRYRLETSQRLFLLKNCADTSAEDRLGCSGVACAAPIGHPVGTEGKP